MNIVEQQREQVIRENNTAQKQLLDILDNYSRQSATLNIQLPLHGDVNLLPLQELGFGLINNIIFSKGEITSIQNIPKSVTSITCSENLVKTLENLPSSLTHINFSDNVLDSINVSNLKNLQTLILSNNRLTSLENLPSSLTELICDHNRLQQLDLQDLVNLQKLNISNNKITLVENMHENVELIMENNPGIIFRNSDVSQIGGDDNTDQTNTNYDDALNEYFRMKNLYEKRVHDKKKAIYGREPNKKIAKRLLLQYNPDCVKCGRPVGSIFKKKEDNKYIAICGDTQNPCSLNIEIFTGSLLNSQLIFDISKEDFDDIRDIVKKVKAKILPKVQGLVPSEESAAAITASSIGKAYLEYPSVVYINLLGVNEDHYPRFKPCMCSNITINYAEGNVLTVAEGGVPMGISIQMAFQELEIQTAEDYDADPNAGVSFDLVAEVANATPTDTGTE